MGRGMRASLRLVIGSSFLNKALSARYEYDLLHDTSERISFMRSTWGYDEEAYVSRVRSNVNVSYMENKMRGA